MAEDIDKLILDLIDPNLDIPGSMRPLRHAASLALRSQQSRIKELEQSNDEEAAAMLAAAPTAPAAVGGEDFQSRVQPWMMACFGAEISADRLERGDRLLEEVLELLQSVDYPRERVAALTDYVFGRAKGEPAQEVGGVMVTLAAYCLAHGIDMHEAGDRELARVWTKVDAIRAKQAAKPKGSALPVPPEMQHERDPAPAAVGGVSDEDAERLALAIGRAKDIFVNVPYLEDDESCVPGAGYLTWEDLYLLLEFTRDRFNREDPELQRERGAVAGQDGMIHPCALKGTGPAATLSLSERVPTASDDVVGAMATVIASAMDHCETHNVSCGEPSEFIARAVLSSPPLREMREAMQSMTDAIGNMRVPQNTADAALQVSVTLGPAYERARSILSRFQSVGGEKHDHADGASAEAVEKVTQPK